MDESLLCAGAIGDVRPKGFMPLLECQCHWGVASLHPEEACVNTLVPQDMAQAVPVLGKTFDHNASDFWPGMRRGQSFLNRPGNHHGITPSLDRCRRPR